MQLVAGRERVTRARVGLVLRRRKGWALTHAFGPWGVALREEV